MTNDDMKNILDLAMQFNKTITTTSFLIKESYGCLLVFQGVPVFNETTHVIMDGERIEQNHCVSLFTIVITGLANIHTYVVRGKFTKYTSR